MTATHPALYYTTIQFHRGQTDRRTDRRWPARLNCSFVSSAETRVARHAALRLQLNIKGPSTLHADTRECDDVHTGFSRTY